MELTVPDSREKARKAYQAWMAQSSASESPSGNRHAASSAPRMTLPAAMPITSKKNMSSYSPRQLGKDNEVSTSNLLFPSIDM